jgi:septum formation protein
MIILATKSQTRRSLLTAAGVAFTAKTSPLDEASMHAALKDLKPRDMAITLATAKAQAFTACQTDDLIIALDQTFDLEGEVLHKPHNQSQAAEHLTRLSGKTHHLHTAYTIIHAQNIVAQHCDTSTLTMRTLSPDYIDDYLDKTPKDILTSVGCYQLEAYGIQLMQHIEGDYFSILGLPLLPLLAHLRHLGALPS